MDSCAHNTTTDCLLQQLVDHSQGFDWNPLNFAFTALLSILGLLVAVIALFQALLAAGPGRLKASQSAIGEYYNASARTRFDWHELRLRTTVDVPIITLDSVLANRKVVLPPKSPWLAAIVGLLERNRYFKALFADVRLSLPGYQTSAEQRIWNRNGTKGRIRYLVARLLRRADLRLHFETDASGVSAGWFRLIHSLRLDDVAFECHRRKTDYLPNELQAAPAYCTIEAALVLAYLSGCTDTVDDTLLVGSNAELELREHDVDGLRAVYQEYGASDSRRARTWESVRWGCVAALGRFAYDNDLLFYITVNKNETATRHDAGLDSLVEDITAGYPHCSHETCGLRNQLIPDWNRFLRVSSYQTQLITALLFCDTPRSFEACPTKCLELKETLRLLGKKCSTWTWDFGGLLSSLRILPRTDSALIVFKFNHEQDSIEMNQNITTLHEFHLRKHMSSGSFTNLFFETSPPTTNGQSWYKNWSADKDHDTGCKNAAIERPYRQAFPLGPDTLVQGKKPVGEFSLSPAFGDLLISEDAFQNCAEYMQLDTHASSDEDKNTLNWMVWQLVEIDWWLENRAGMEAICACLNLLQKMENLDRGKLQDQDSENGGSTTEPETAAEKVPNRPNRNSDDNSMALVLYSRSSVESGSGTLLSKSRSTWPKQSRPISEPHRRWTQENRRDAEARVFDTTSQKTNSTPDKHLPHPLNGSETLKADQVPISSTRNPDEKGNDEIPVRRNFVTVTTDKETPDGDNSPKNRPPNPSCDAESSAESTNLPDPGYVTYKSENRLKAMEALVLYRALLVGALLASGWDTTDLLERDDRHRIIQIL